MKSMNLYVNHTTFPNQNIRAMYNIAKTANVIIPSTTLQTKTICDIYN